MLAQLPLTTLSPIIALQSTTASPKPPVRPNATSKSSQWIWEKQATHLGVVCLKPLHQPIFYCLANLRSDVPSQSTKPPFEQDGKIAPTKLNQTYRRPRANCSDTESRLSTQDIRDRRFPSFSIKRKGPSGSRAAQARSTLTGPADLPSSRRPSRPIGPPWRQCCSRRGCSGR